MTDRAHDIAEEAARLEAFTRDELSGDLREDRGKVVEAVLFLAQEMGSDHNGYGPHIAELAKVALSLERVADEIERHDERQAFTRRALANEVGTA